MIGELEKHIQLIIFLIDILNKIPIIGGLLEDALKSDYEFKDLKER